MRDAGMGARVLGAGMSSGFTAPWMDLGACLLVVGVEACPESSVWTRRGKTSLNAGKGAWVLWTGVSAIISASWTCQEALDVSGTSTRARGALEKTSLDYLKHEGRVGGVCEG